MSAGPTITLYGFPKHENEPSTSGYCQKLETFFRATGFTTYTHSATLNNYAPKKKLPYIELKYPFGKVETIADSHFIIKRLIANGITSDPDASLTPTQRSDSRAWIVWTEELIYSAIVNTRWGRDHNYNSIVQGLPVPWPLQSPLGWYLRRNITSALWTAGVGRHSEEELESILQEYVDALALKLDGTEFFFGTEPTLVDVVAYSFLANSLCVGEGNSEYQLMILKKERLKTYVASLTERWFPEYRKLLEKVNE
ncbi:hypothetical protein K493DRAFT_223573 [Basidiobolus meristosporus CBS 931.73]|uniref:Thioredoxin-like fold domain-containing protein n=1 Tax=Basidiobolus meristosporus CBS 931.73 TaxID=1314790 RepID=A0A1Y1Y5N3_9FUNG|nr:hypothetical protein K493DRAFT_223573 [Basidiobolus meristosporus CBS 931.73]|eukprot:ORX93288.1 hypothetical protein K493DRAFT_223573 [Basidiobolus meristosporus CBS 931.73]